MENSLDATSYGAIEAAHAVLGNGGVNPLRQRTVAARRPVTEDGTINRSRQKTTAHARSVVPRSGTTSNDGTPCTPCNPAKRARKDRGPNWVAQEITALVNAKRDMFLEELDVVDGRDLMNPDTTKWIRISTEVMKAGYSPCHRDGPACKAKWNQIIPDYKRIADFFSRTGTNGIEFWDMTATERKTEGLPRSFPQDIFCNLQEWFGKRPSMQPPHTRDLLSNEDNNYNPPPSQIPHDEQEDYNDADSEDPMDFVDAVEGADENITTTVSPAPPANCGRGAPQVSRSSPTPTPNPRSRKAFPLGVTPELISSSDTSEISLRRKTGNTAVRRKHLSGHSLIAEATRASGDIMAGQMREMAEASKDLERSKIEVQLKLFTEQMEYQRDKDRRLQENARVANENAKMAIEKQGEVVKCLANLSYVLAAGLHLPKGRLPQPEPQVAPANSELQEAVAQVAPPKI